MTYLKHSIYPEVAKVSVEAAKGIKSGNMVTAGKELDAILGLRDLYISTGVLMAAFSHSMNLLGGEGWFANDYTGDISDESKEKVTAAMKALGEI